MTRRGGVSTRRRFFGVTLAGAASIPLLGCNDSGNGQTGNSGQGAGSGGGSGGCCCLLKGTNVSTPAGERPVEDLRIGAEVVTLAGPKAVKWIGYNKFTKDADRSWQARVMPVRVARSAIDDEVPHRDLFLSPEHCVFFNDVLIPVKCLVNGTTIAPGMPSGLTAIEYYHIEFDTHEVVLAEGAPVESFLEESTEREYFLNFVEYERLYGRDRRHPVSPYAPILGYRNRHEKVTAMARLLVSSVVDVRDAIQIARDQLARRAETLLV